MPNEKISMQLKDENLLFFVLTCLAVTKPFVPTDRGVHFLISWSGFFWWFGLKEEGSVLTIAAVEVQRVNLPGPHQLLINFWRAKEKTLLWGKKATSYTLHQRRNVFAGNCSCERNNLSQNTEEQKNVFLMSLICLLMCLSGYDKERDPAGILMFYP